MRQHREAPPPGGSPVQRLLPRAHPAGPGSLRLRSHLFDLLERAADSLAGQRVEEILSTDPKLTDLPPPLDARRARLPPLRAPRGVLRVRGHHPPRPAARAQRLSSRPRLPREPLSARLAAIVGHELRAPLATALMYMGIVERQIEAGAGGSSLRSALAVAREEILRIERLIVRVTELQRLGHPVLHPRQVDIGRVVGATVRRALFADTAAQVKLVPPPRALTGWWDDAAIEQIVQNLLSNAFKFGAGRPIQVAVEQAGDGVRVVVRDQGVGIKAGDLDRIFRCHVRAPVERSGGLGLGLWLVRSLAEAHRGRVMVQSRPGEGSTFTVVLRPLPRPLRPDADGPAPAVD